MSAYQIPRREFLVRALGACGASLLAPMTAAAGVPQSAAPDVRTARSYVGADGVAAAQTIGAAYARHLGMPQDVDSIVRAAAGTLELIGKAADEDVAVELLVEAVRRDFGERRSVQLEGWVLARTELDLCLLTLT